MRQEMRIIGESDLIFFYRGIMVNERIVQNAVKCAKATVVGEMILIATDFRMLSVE